MSAKVIPIIVTVVSTRMNGDASSTMFVPTMSGTATSRSGTVPTQYFDQKIVRTSRGEERISHIIRPSIDIAGKTKRAAIAATTKPASPRFRNDTALMSRKETCSPV